MNSAVIVALPIGNETYIYKDGGDEVPIHQTLVFMGDSINITPDEAYEVRVLLNDISNNAAPFTAEVIGKGHLGKDGESIVITSAHELYALRNILTTNTLVASLMSRTEQHPGYVSHISGLQRLRFGDHILFNRLGFWYGEDRMVFDFKRPSVFLSENVGYTAPEGIGNLDLGLDDDNSTDDN